MDIPIRGVGKLVRIEFQLFFREPAAIFFAMIYPIVLVAVNGTGTNKAPGTDLSMIDASAPVITTFIISILGLCTLPPFLAYYRERGILRRLALTPMPPPMLLVAQFVVHVVIALAALALVFTFGMTAFGMNGPASPGVFVLMSAVGGLSMFAIGFLVSAVAPTSRTATGIGLGLFFPMAVVSGGMIPREVLSESVRSVGEFTPMSPVVRSLSAAYTGDPVNVVWLVAMIAVSLVATALAVRLFRW